MGIAACLAVRRRATHPRGLAAAGPQLLFSTRVAFRYILLNITVRFVVRGGAFFGTSVSRARRGQTSQ
ncbi:hypothetical protein B0G73_102343 [Paraburkholderia sp. BL25I1N1]|nr:hypothetical protein B0G73_102343 [Paraburkholderia sp. BL25I1N1]